jgi:hypothetical protein
MDVIEDVYANKDLILRCIEKFGYAPEHNFWYFLNLESKDDKCLFFNFENDFGLMAQAYKDNTSMLISEVLAPEERRLDVFEEVLDCMLLKKHYKKVFVCVPLKFMKLIENLSKRKQYRLSKNSVAYCPVYNLRCIDETLRGKDWKKLRNIKNSFYAENKVEVIPSTDISKEKLKRIIKEWKASRGTTSRAYYAKYMNFIENNFYGTDHSRTLIVNGVPSSIAAGWRIPNSNNYYSAIGIYNYRFKYLGEIINLEDLLYIKKMGYDYADFGDSDKGLLNFKKKFNPEYIYKTYSFSIRKND